MCWPIYSFWEGNGNPLLYSCLENPMDRGIWHWATVHGVAELDTTKQLSLHFIFFISFSPPINVAIGCHGRGKSVSENLMSFPKIMHLVCGRAVILIQVFWILECRLLITRLHYLGSVSRSRNIILLVQQSFCGRGNSFLLIPSMKTWCSEGLRETKVCPKALDISLRRLSGHHLHWEIGQAAWKESSPECMPMVHSLKTLRQSLLAGHSHPAWESPCLCTHTHVHRFAHSKTNIPNKVS